MARFLLDTNVIIAHLAGEGAIPVALGLFAVSALTIFELQRYPGISTAEDEKARALLNYFEVLPVTESVAERAATFGKTRRSHAIDLLIAATAVEHGLTLITRNLKDFRRIRGLTAKAVL